MLSKNKFKIIKEIKNNQNSSWAISGLVWELGYLVAIPAVVCALMGRLLDKKYGTSPWFLLLGITLAIIFTTYIVYRKTIQQLKLIDSETKENILSRKDNN